MTNKIEATRQKVFSRALYQCEHPDCHRPAIHLAHSIAQTKTTGIKANRRMVQKMWRELYGEDLSRAEIDEIIHWPEGLHAVCGRPECNDHFNTGNNPEKVREHLKRFYEIKCLTIT
jgi:hypothetical protein